MKSDTRIYALMTLVAFLWSGAFIAGKYTGPYIPSCSVTFMRFAIALILIYFIMKKIQSKDASSAYHFDKKDIPHFLFTGIVGMVGYHIFFFEALNYTTAINSSIIRAVDPVITVLIAFIFLHQRVPLKQLLGILLSLAGVILTITAGDLSHLAEMNFNRGDLYMICAVVCWAAYGVYSKAKCSHIPAVVLTFYSFPVCAVVLIPFSLMEKPWEFIGDIPVSAWIALLFMAVFCSGFAYYIQQYALRIIGPARCSIFVNLVPVFSFILASLMLGEELQPIKILTTAVIIAGVCICQITGQSKQRSEDNE